MEKLNEVLNNQYGKSDYRLEAAYQKEYDELLTNARSAKTKVLVIAIIVSVVILFSTTLTINKLYTNNTFYRPSMNVQYFREIPSNLDPYFAATLVFSKERKKKELKK